MNPNFEDSMDSSSGQKFQLPDIIKLSHANLKQLSLMNTKQSKSFLDQFDKSIQLNEEEENKIQRLLGDGRKTSMNHKINIKSVQVYQKVENLKILDPLNVKKLNYAK